MDAAYWKARCERAEEALRRARTAIALTPQRRAVLQLLGELRAGQTLNTREVAEQLAKSEATVICTLATMHAVGLLDREPGRRGTAGQPSRWSLAHLVTVADETAEVDS